MPARKKTLAEELAELATTAPTKEIDPEADLLGAEARVEDTDEELDEVPAKRRGKEKGLRLVPNVDLGQEYAGKRTTRKAAFQAAESSDEAASEGAASEPGTSSDDEFDDNIVSKPGKSARGSAVEEDGSEYETGDSEGMAMGDDDSEEDGGSEYETGDSDGMSGENEDLADGQLAEGGTNGAAGGSARESESGSDVEDDDMAGPSGNESDEGALVGAVDGPGRTEELKQLAREFDALQAADAGGAAAFRERAAREAAKGRAVRAQRSVWERVLAMRIMLQRSLHASHQLPRPDVQPLARSATPELSEAYRSLADVASETLGELLSLSSALMAQNPAIAAAAAEAGHQPAANGVAGAAEQRANGGAGTEAGGQAAIGGTGQRLANGVAGKRGRSGYGDGEAGDEDGVVEAKWRRIEEQHAALGPFRDSSIDRWHRKTVLATGRGAMRANLRALNSSVAAQLAAAMTNPAKLVTRTQLLRSYAPRPLGHPNSAEPEPLENGAPAQDANSGLDPEAAAGLREEEDRDPETFDDAEFYQQLLKELLETGPTCGLASKAVKGRKIRKAVDRRASKGRKLRFHVHEKLVNFMTPVPQASPVFAKQLFANLFGGGTAR